MEEETLVVYKLWLLHRSMALMEEEGTATVSLYIWGVQKLEQSFIVAQSGQWVKWHWIKWTLAGGGCDWGAAALSS